MGKPGFPPGGLASEPLLVPPGIDVTVVKVPHMAVPATLSWNVRVARGILGVI